MRFHSWLLELVLTPSYLFLFFVIVTLVFHLAFVWVGKLNEVQWKYADYYWLVGAVWGFVWLSTDINRTFSETYVQNNDVEHIKAEYRELVNHLSNGIPVCLTYHKSELSPPTFDENMAENKVLCSTSRAYVEAMPKEVNAPFPSLEELGFKGFDGHYSFNDDYIKDTQEHVKRYSTSQSHYVQLMEASKPSDTLQLIRLLSPLAFALACALRIAKVTGEIQIAKRKRLYT